MKKQDRALEKHEAATRRAARRRRKQATGASLLGLVVLITAVAAWRAQQDLSGANMPELLAQEEIWQLPLEELTALIEEDLARGVVPALDWRVLRELDVATGERSPLLVLLDGKRVRVPGFAVPLEDYAEEFAEFLIVPWAGACIHTPPPPPNQMVYAQMKAGRSASAPWWDPVWIEGVLHVVPTDSPYGMVGYQLEGERVLPFSWD
jgi:uncharacterized protein